MIPVELILLWFLELVKWLHKQYWSGIRYDQMVFWENFVSWLGLSPTNKTTGGKIFNTRTKKVKNNASIVFRIAALNSSKGKFALAGFKKKYRETMVINLKKQDTRLGFTLTKIEPGIWVCWRSLLIRLKLLNQPKVLSTIQCLGIILKPTSTILWAIASKVFKVKKHQNLVLSK